MLPVEVLIKIFSFLSPKMLQTCSLVCKRWDNVINNSRMLMEPFQLDLQKVECMKNDRNKMKRKHYSIIAKNLNEYSLQVIRSQNLHTLHFSTCDVGSKTLVEVLNKINTLEVFEATSIRFTDDDYTKIDFMKVRNNRLKSLKIRNCCPGVFEIFDVHKLIIFDGSSIFDVNCKAVIDLLKNQNNLKNLSIGGTLRQQFFSSNDIFNFNFQLKSFSVDRANRGNYLNNLLLFILLHQNTLISLKCLCESTGEFQKLIIEKLSNLKYLEMNFGELIKKDQNFLAQIKPNNHVESVKFHSSYGPSTNLNLVSSRFTNLKHVDLGKFCFAMELLLHLSKTAQNLYSLTVGSLGNCEEDLHFPKLKEFAVEKSSGEAHFIKFVLRHSRTLEKINFGYIFPIFQQDFVNGLLKCEHLNHIIIAKYIPSELKRLFNTFMAKNRSYKLQIEIDDGSKIFFKFPEDKAVWDERCNIWSFDLINRMENKFPHEYDKFRLCEIIRKLKD